jgi:hypothetical protein
VLSGEAGNCLSNPPSAHLFRHGRGLACAVNCAGAVRVNYHMQVSGGLIPSVNRCEYQLGMLIMCILIGVNRK